MTLVKQPYRNAFNGSFNNLLDDFFAPYSSYYGDRNPARTLTPVNVRETDNGFALDVVAPGFVKEEFSVALDKNVLTVSAERKSESSDKTVKFLRNEYKFASFKRSFNLDDSIDGSAISAQYVNGVLTLNLPKKESVKPVAKQIDIQ